MPRGNQPKKGRGNPPPKHNKPNPQSTSPPVTPTTPRYYPLMHRPKSIFDKDTEGMGRGPRPEGGQTKYREEYNTLAYKLCLLGASDKEMAGVFEVDVATLYTWLKTYPLLRKAVNEGKIIADAEIAHSMFHRAKGYSHTDTHIAVYLGAPVVTETEKHYPPDTGAGKNWLSNRRRNNPDPNAVNWAERKEITGEDGKGLFSQDEVDKKATLMRNQLLTTLVVEGEEG